MRRLSTLLTILLLSFVGLSAQMPAGEPFNGVILRADGRGLKARIEVVGRDKTTFSDAKGRFGLTDVEADDTLRIIFKGSEVYIPVVGRRSIRIRFEEQLLDFSAEEDAALTNIGYGYVKRREKIDFSSGISGDRLRATGHSNIVDALLVCAPSSLRMINGELTLYAQNSINSPSPILILCDGQEVNPAYINIADVESVEILKGANMYGFRGAGGVILITTKR